MQQRYYDPGIGRFISPDPAESEFNRYSYTSNNPYRFVDPDGRETTVVINGNVMPLDISTWGGKHAGLIISRGDVTQIYDPNGSFHREHRGSDGLVAPDDANAKKYVESQLEDGPEVRTYTFETTPEEEAVIMSRIAPEDGSNSGEGEGGFFSCSDHVSNVISGVGPFSNVQRNTTLPLNLESQVSDAKQAQEKKVDDPTRQVIGTYP